MLTFLLASYHRIVYNMNSVPRIGLPAPAFKASALIDGQIKEVSLSDYAGKVQDGLIL